MFIIRSFCYSKKIIKNIMTSNNNIKTTCKQFIYFSVKWSNIFIIIHNLINNSKMVSNNHHDGAKCYCVFLTIFKILKLIDVNFRLPNKCLSPTILWKIGIPLAVIHFYRFFTRRTFLMHSISIVIRSSSDCNYGISI